MDMKKSTVIFITLAILLILAAGIITYNMANKSATGKIISDPNEPVKVLLHTNMGDITIELREDMPITAGNFESLVEKGTYNGVIFHRIIDKFMIQGGDPTGTGYGDPSIPKIEDEFNGVQKNNRGTIAMANAGANTGSSQFFINLVNNNFLDGKHPVFGDVVVGMDVVDKIAKVETDSNDKPLSPVTIISARIL